MFATVMPRSLPSRLRKLARLRRRLRLVSAYYRGVPSSIVSWALRSSEDSNFTYDITHQNREYLAATVAVVAGIDIARARLFIAEPDRELWSCVARRLTELGIGDTDAHPRFGRRLGWYAMARALKPKVIVETGVDRGLGSVLLCSALQRNAREGHPGRYYGTDIRADAGELLGEPWASYGKIIYGDSLESLGKLDEIIDLFINDSDHSAQYEYREYQTVKPKLAQGAVILGDNAHSTDMLLRFSEENGRRFLFFKEAPAGHWYPGAGIGISFH